MKPVATILAFLLYTFLGVTQAGDVATVRTAFQRDCERLLLASIQSAREEILVACYSFSRDRIAEALIRKSQAGVTVKIKMDERQAGSDFCRSTVALLRRAPLEMRLITMPKYRSMHHKFMVIDGQWILTGSYNFTNAATYDNWENLVRIESPTIAAQFKEEWTRITDRADDAKQRQSEH